MYVKEKNDERKIKQINILHKGKGLFYVSSDLLSE